MNDNSFYSIDKLVEFGMGVSVANQMINSMNQTIDKMKIPGANNTMTKYKDDIYYVVVDSEKEGPYTLADISRLITEKKVFKESYIWKPGMDNWDLVQNVKEVLEMVALNPPPIPKDM